MTGSVLVSSTLCVYLVLLVLPGVREAGDDGGDAGRGGDLAGVDHDQQLHEVVVDFATTALDDVHVLTTHAFPNFNTVQGKKETMLLEDMEDLRVRFKIENVHRDKTTSLNPY